MSDRYPLKGTAKHIVKYQAMDMRYLGKSQ